jgi:hypothetical protein
MASWPPSIVYPTASIGPVFLISSIPSDPDGPERSQPRLLRLMEHGVRSPTMRAVVKLAAVLNVKPSEIVQQMEALLSRLRKSKRTARV